LKGTLSKRGMVGEVGFDKERKRGKIKGQIVVPWVSEPGYGRGRRWTLCTEMKGGGREGRGKLRVNSSSTRGAITGTGMDCANNGRGGEKHSRWL